MDQAATLRTWQGKTWEGASEGAQVIAIASGKGGVGKTNVVANLSVAMAKLGKKVLAVDGDLGLANLDLALGINPRRTFLDVVQGHAAIDDILTPAPGGVSVLPACSGRYELANLGEQQLHGLFSAIDTLETRFDTLLVDTGAGIGANAMTFASAAQKVVVVLNSEPTSLADAYAFVKVLSTRCVLSRIYVVTNMVRSASEGERVYERFAKLVDRFLNLSSCYLGYVAADNAIVRAICAGVPVVLGEPRSAAAQCLESIAHKLANDEESSLQPGGIQLFWKRLLGWSCAS